MIKHWCGAEMFYILKGRKPVEVDVQEWMNCGQFKKIDERRVDKSFVGDAEVSTMFLGFDHGIGKRPVLFETMIFGGKHNGYCSRSCTYSEAEREHRKALSLLGI